MQVNGKDIALSDNNISLEEFVIDQGYMIERIAVELNGEIIPKQTYASVILNPQDTIEIVQFVGGG